jgi:hypothetical protein
MKSSSRRLVLLGASLLATATMSTISAGVAGAHTHTVDPQGNGAGFTKPISNPWAQAHCKAQAPIVHAEVDAASSFNPAAHLPCPPVENPGGQVHGD